VLRDFSGYIAADELYDGPYCILSIVDNHKFRRILYEVLDHKPTGADIERFFRRFKQALDDRGLRLSGITTDGSPLYPAPVAAVFGGVEHQVCQFHIIADLTKAVLHALSVARKNLLAQVPKRTRGRPSAADRRAVRRAKRTQEKAAALFDHRYLFVQHGLSPAEKRTLKHITRGLPHLRALRDIMDEVYRLFDRRCRCETALAKLAKLRQRVRRFHSVGHTLRTLFSPNVEKALTFLDDSLLPSTSNAVERANRRHTKMQKTVYRVRAEHNIRRRIALDMLREAGLAWKHQTTNLLHGVRRGVKNVL